MNRVSNSFLMCTTALLCPFDEGILVIILKPRSVCKPQVHFCPLPLWSDREKLLQRWPQAAWTDPFPRRGGFCHHPPLPSASPSMHKIVHTLCKDAWKVGPWLESGNLDLGKVPTIPRAGKSASPSLNCLHKQCNFS